MSRNQEKAKASLNRWRQYTNTRGSADADEGTKPVRMLASDCMSLTECEERRKSLVEAISALVEEIQTVPPDDNCKRLNDKINKLLRIKEHWERQIRVLGGPDYRQHGKRNDGYMYFGAARELPEVKVLLKQKEAETVSSSIATTVTKTPIDRKLLTYQYYGFDDEDLLSNEAKAESMARKSALEEYQRSNPAVLQSTENDLHWDASWSIPTNEDVEAALLEYRKLELLRKYAT